MYYTKKYNQKQFRKCEELMSTEIWNLITETLNPNDSIKTFIDKFLKNHSQNEKTRLPADYNRDQKIIKGETAP